MPRPRRLSLPHRFGDPGRLPVLPLVALAFRPNLTATTPYTVYNSSSRGSVGGKASSPNSGAALQSSVFAAQRPVGMIRFRRRFS